MGSRGMEARQGMYYHFDELDACKYGIPEALLLDYITRGLEYESTHVRSGQTAWLTITLTRVHLPFLSQTEIDAAYDHLLRANVIHSVTSSEHSAQFLCTFTTDEYAIRLPTRDEPQHPAPRVHTKQIPRKPKAGHVYLILDNERGWHKIGISAKVHKRLGAYDDITIVGLFESADMRKDEKELHRVFSDKRVSGEWFNLDGNDIEQIRAYPFTLAIDGTEATHDCAA